MKNLDSRVDEAYTKYEKLGHLELPDLFDWLDKERIRGSYNMLEAPTHLLSRWRFDLRDIKEATLVVKAWMETY